MRPSVLYRVDAVLLVLFALGHTVGFRQVDPQWGIDAVIAQMKAASFHILGMQQTYWDFFVGFGFFVSIFPCSLAITLCLALAAWSGGRTSASA